MRSQSEVQAGILRRTVAHAAFRLIVADKISRRQLEMGSNTIPIAARTNQANLQPVIPMRALVMKQLCSFTVVVHQKIQRAVVIKIPDSQTSTHMRGEKSGILRGTRIHEMSTANVAVQLFGSA